MESDQTRSRDIVPAPAPASDVVEPPLEPGVMLGAWRVAGVLGEGAMGRVYLAEHSAIGRRAAVKVLRRNLAEDSRSVERFFDEARAVNAVHHRGIVDVTDLFVIAGRPCIVMELLTGETLAQRLSRSALSIYEALSIASDVADALAAAHAHGIVHRDVKPDNIMLLASGFPRLKVLDFGVAKLGGLMGEGSIAGSIVGTPEYMSPEQLAGTDVDHRADIYTLGVLLYTMLTGVQPFRGSSFGDWVVQHMTTPAPDPRGLSPDVSAELANIVLQMLAKDPDARPQSMAVVGALLEELAGPLRPSPFQIGPTAQTGPITMDRTVPSLVASLPPSPARSSLPSPPRGSLAPPPSPLSLPASFSLPPTSSLFPPLPTPPPRSTSSPSLAPLPPSSLPVRALMLGAVVLVAALAVGRWLGRDAPASTSTTTTTLASTSTPSSSAAAPALPGLGAPAEPPPVATAAPSIAAPSTAAPERASTVTAPPATPQIAQPATAPTKATKTTKTTTPTTPTKTTPPPTNTTTPTKTTPTPTTKVTAPPSKSAVVDPFAEGS